MELGPEVQTKNWFRSVWEFLLWAFTPTWRTENWTIIMKIKLECANTSHHVHQFLHLFYLRQEQKTKEVTDFYLCCLKLFKDLLQSFNMYLNAAERQLPESFSNSAECRPRLIDWVLCTIPWLANWPSLPREVNPETTVKSLICCRSW
jgi:hypothetical protein